MTPNEFKLIRRSLGHTQREFSRCIGLSADNGHRTLQRWEAGDIPIPGPVITLLWYIQVYGLRKETKGYGNVVAATIIKPAHE